ncbi:5-(carboxyamino)imidazole ribonucleotide synthase [Hephaestia caeni]|uniref:N5-carboxyaminoimidazole ribonucleotide synthase n=1 Tax=Hephaestia caeni TaxID=645617 RepID=A0A397PEP7_9SPHN|nr:5-(carboxyamino)imidazole ribonucleotide synthase [Hephaestia caeni]RIA44624.1 5-(carboxyamino)imidazole ribonucleotide synthase [Hephaestia caeni]
MTPLPPGSTIGILGAGQLGRMIAVAAAQLGYRCHIFAPSPGPGCDVARSFTAAAWDDLDAVDAFAGVVDVVTYEFENVDLDVVDRLAASVPVRPGKRSLEISRDRMNEKNCARDLGGRTAPFAAVTSRAELDAAIAEIGCPAILKTTRFGYDGKGQARLASADDADAAWEAIGGGPAVLEGFVRFDHEFSIVLARREDGAMTSYAPPRNEHENGILHRSTLPAPAEIAAQWTEAAALTGRIAEALGHVGVLTGEYFATPQGPVFNEMAPRVHNSGHWTIEGARCSQFENHVRAICGLPLGDTGLTAPGVTMENLIGDEANRWADLLAEPGAHVHLYGKTVRPGRKMGHVTRLMR